MPSHELLIGAAEFWARARADIAAARRRVLVQAMSFEGDATGLAVADAIVQSRAAVRRVAVDDYTRWVVNDRWVHTRAGRRDAALQAEVRSTAAMFADLQAAGVEVVWTEPVRRLWRDYPFRNHRKMIVADDVAYLGGINFSDHNFAWTDLMVRIERHDVADRLAMDFPSSPPPRSGGGGPRVAGWRGLVRRRSFSRSVKLEPPSPGLAWSPPPASQGEMSDGELGGLTLYDLNGRNNGPVFQALMWRLDEARDEIVVLSPYLTFPFTAAMARAARRGVRVVIVTPHENNKPLLRDYIVAFARREGVQLVQTPAMSHVKAVIVDDATVILGSSNFDFVSYEAEAEIIATFEDPALALDLRRRLVEPALMDAVKRPAAVSAVSGLVAAGALRLAQGYIRVLKALRSKW